MNATVRVAAFLDACVLYPAPIRDLLLHIAETNLYVPKWTDYVHEEWSRNLLANREDIRRESLQKAINAMNGAFPNAIVSGYEHLIDSIHLPDQDDEHVLAAAIHGNAQLIVTANLQDFPQDILSRHGIMAIHPDSFVCSLIDQNSNTVLTAFRTQVARLRSPPMTTGEVIQKLREAGLERTADKLSTML